MTRLGMVLLMLACCPAVAAQQLPEIHDVYASERSRDAQQLGPTDDPNEVLRRFAQCMEQTEVVQYDVHVTYAVPAGAGETSGGYTGTVALGRGLHDAFDRFRVTLAGTTPVLGPVAVTVGSTGREFYVVDALRGTTRRSDVWDGASPLCRLAEYALIARPSGGWLHDESDDEPTWLGLATVGAESRYRIHFTHAVGEEHVYGTFSAIDGLPRTLEHVAPGPAGIPRVITTEITNLRMATEVDPGLFEVPEVPIPESPAPRR